MSCTSGSLQQATPVFSLQRFHFMHRTCRMTFGRRQLTSFMTYSFLVRWGMHSLLLCVQ